LAAACSARSSATVRAGVGHAAGAYSEPSSMRGTDARRRRDCNAGRDAVGQSRAAGKTINKLRAMCIERRGCAGCSARCGIFLRNIVIPIPTRAGSLLPRAVHPVQRLHVLLELHQLQLARLRALRSATRVSSTSSSSCRRVRSRAYTRPPTLGWQPRAWCLPAML
jgi:hypothetical protein